MQAVRNAFLFVRERARVCLTPPPPKKKTKTKKTQSHPDELVHSYQPPLVYIYFLLSLLRLDS